MKRVGAVLAVAAMVIGAFLVRDQLTGADDDDGGDRRIAGDGSPVVCADDLGPACRDALGSAATTAAAGSMADRLLAATSADELGGDAWLVTDAWARLVLDERDRLGRPPLFEVDGAPLASSSILLTVWTDRADELRTRCEALDWRCLAEQAGSTLAAGDRVRVATPPIDSATGLPVAAGQMASLVGRADYAANDFDGGIRSLADRLAAGQTADPVRTMRSRGPGQVTAASAATALSAGSFQSTFGTIEPTTVPAPRIDVVLLVPTGEPLDDDRRRRLTEALLTVGWEPPADGDAQLPEGGVLAAVRTLWKES